MSWGNKYNNVLNKQLKIKIMKTKHTTEAQWTYELSKPYETLNIKSGTIYIAELNNVSFNDERGNQTEANAKLIAAAPELLEALKLALSFMITDPQHQGRNILNTMKDALKKATT